MANGKLTLHPSMADKGKARWSTTLVGFFVDKSKRAPFHVILNQARLKWNKYDFRELTTSGNGVYYFKIDDEKGCDDNLSNNSWTIARAPI